MSDTSSLIQSDDEYWRLARGFVRVLLSDLNDSLKECRLTKAKRRIACEKAAFSICNTIDQYWIRSDGKTAYPLLAFSKRFLDVDIAIEDILPIQLPHRSVELHAMVCDEIRWLFDDQKETLPENSMGVIGDEVPDEEVTQEINLERIQLPCYTCKGQGTCYCIRKGPGNATGCPRCAGSGKCPHCHGTGVDGAG